jgi:hypothetical protein
MTETTRWIGTNAVLDSGTVMLGVDDGPFAVTISGLLFIIEIINDPRSPALDPQRESRERMRVKINIANQVPTQFKFQVATINSRDVYLAVRVSRDINFYLLTYTFSVAR